MINCGPYSNMVEATLPNVVPNVSGKASRLSQMIVYMASNIFATTGNRFDKYVPTELTRPDKLEYIAS